MVVPASPNSASYIYANWTVNNECNKYISGFTVYGYNVENDAETVTVAIDDGSVWRTSIESSLFMLCIPYWFTVTMHGGSGESLSSSSVIQLYPNFHGNYYWQDLQSICD